MGIALRRERTMGINDLGLRRDPGTVWAPEFEAVLREQRDAQLRMNDSDQAYEDFEAAWLAVAL